MKHKHLILLVAMLAFLALAGSAVAGETQPRHDFTEVPPPDVSQSEYVIVSFKDRPAASYTGGIPGLERTKPERGQKLNANDPDVRAYVDHLGGKHQDYRNFMARNAPRAEVVREYFLVANALTIKLNGEARATLANGPGASRVTYSQVYFPTMNRSVDLIGASDLWSAIGGRDNAGAGIKVGVIDSGIDETHRFFACKDEIPHKVYFSGQGLNPDDVLTNDHGTHVAGTIAGCTIELTDGPIQDTISGVAPAAQLFDYNVFPGAGAPPGSGGAFSHDIIFALEDSVKDGMDVVNMSLGGGVDGPHDILAEAVNATVDAGIVAAVAAGNSGPGDSTVSSPGSAAKALTAGASTNGHVIGVAVTVDGTDYRAASGDFGPYGADVSASLVDWNDATSDDDALACDAADTPAVLEGNIALISRGACTFTTKVRNAQNAGAVGALLYNSVAGPPVGMAHDGTDPKPTIPSVMVSKDDGATIRASLPATGTIAGVTSELPAQADVLAGFSSRGPTPFTYLIKPDVTAPGVNIYSSVFNDEFAAFQGTSMATPHLAGSAALLLQLHPDWSPADVKSAIVNTAERTVTDSVTGTTDPGVLARGNGRANVSRAHTTPVTFDPVSVSYGYWTGNKAVRDDVTVTLSDAVGDGASCSFEVSGDPYVTPTSGNVEIAADGSATVTLSLDAGRTSATPSGDYSGDVTFTCDGTELLVPWWVRINRQAKP